MKFLDIGQVKGIYADGVHDDAAAIQRCLDEMKNGGEIFFPDGTYLISSCLIFYSNQHLRFSDKAVLLRSDKSEIITKYMLASYSEPVVEGYNGTHDVVISGGVFDGNANLTEKLTVINTVHCNNIVIKNVRFINGSQWHYIELNSTSNTFISECIFDGASYTARRDNLTCELIQVDAPAVGTYGPVYNCDGKLIDFCYDKTPCRFINIESNIFKCDGFTAIGHHGNDSHSNIKIINNIFKGSSGNADFSRGYITFMEKAHSITVQDNAFIFDGDNKKCIGILTENPNPDSLIAVNNVFLGKFDECFVGGITVM